MFDFAGLKGVLTAIFSPIFTHQSMFVKVSFITRIRKMLRDFSPAAG